MSLAKSWDSVAKKNKQNNKSDETDWVETAICINCRHYDRDKQWCTFKNEITKDNIHCAFFQQTEKQPSTRIDLASLCFEQNYVVMAEEFHKIQPFFYDKNNIWWLWNFENSYWEMVDEIDLMNKIDTALPNHVRTTNSKLKNEILESMKRVGRLKHPEEAPERWIQFKDKAFSLRTGNTYSIQPNYFFTNPIPWKLGETSRTPILDKLFEEWVGKEKVQTLYEIIAYCCYRKYPIQTLFCLYGIGRNGKTQFLKILDKFIGDDNVCSTSLDMLTGKTSSRFESFKMYKKLVALLGETNFGMLESTDLLKKLTGGDKMSFEVKGKNPFNGYSYAKLIIASNSLPHSADNSDGFYRRWVIVDFPNTFKEGKDIFETIPDSEYEALSKRITELLPVLLDKGEFHHQGDINSRRNAYIMASNPLPHFIKEFCEFDINYFMRSEEFYKEYIQYLNKKRRRLVNRKEFWEMAMLEGIDKTKTNKPTGKNDERGYPLYENGWFVNGIRLKKIKENKENSQPDDNECDKCDKCDKVSNSEFPIENLSTKPSHICHKCHKSREMCEEYVESFRDFNIIYVNCSQCGKKEEIRLCNNLPLCEQCYVNTTHKK